MGENISVGVLITWAVTSAAAYYILGIPDDLGGCEAAISQNLRRD